jgi:hypothetical protein
MARAEAQRGGGKGLRPTPHNSSTTCAFGAGMHRYGSGRKRHGVDLEMHGQLPCELLASCVLQGMNRCYVDGKTAAAVHPLSTFWFHPGMAWVRSYLTSAVVPCPQATSPGCWM